MERKKEYEPCLPGEYGSARTTEESLWKLATEMASRRADREEKRRVTQEEGSESEGRTHCMGGSRQGGLTLRRTHSRREGPGSGGSTHSRGGSVGGFTLRRTHSRREGLISGGRPHPGEEDQGEEEGYNQEGDLSC